MPRTKETKGRWLSRVMLTVLSAAIIAASVFIPAARAENPPMTVVYALDSANLTFRDSDAANIMDVCDAVLSRRDLATRQRILKDSHCGAFAVICMVLLAMGQWSLFLAAEDVSWLALLLIPAATRACAGLAVLGLRPMGTSQYAAMGPARGGYGAALWVLLALSVGLPLWLGGSFGPLAAAVGYGLAVWYGFRNLDGMSGDISGFALTIGELCGCGAAILWR